MPSHSTITVDDSLKASCVQHDNVRPGRFPGRADSETMMLISMRTSALYIFATALLAALLLPAAVASSAPGVQSIPPLQGTALDGHAVALPRDLPGRANVLILGFSQHSQDTTTAWEQPVRNSLATTPAIGFYDMPCLEDAPSFVRPLIVRSIRRKVPDALKPWFVPMTSGEAAWKQLVGYTDQAPDAAYVLLVDRNGNVRWQTHEPFSPARFDELASAARRLAAETR